jgi:hypothetical protein
MIKKHQHLYIRQSALVVIEKAIVAKQLFTAIAQFYLVATFTVKDAREAIGTTARKARTLRAKLQPTTKANASLASAATIGAIIGRRTTAFVPRLALAAFLDAAFARFEVSTIAAVHL